MTKRHFWKTHDSLPLLEQPERRCPRDGIFGGGGGGGTVSTNTVQQSDPWAGVQPYLTDVFSKAQGLYNQGSYQGNYIAPQSPYTQQAIQMQAQQAMDPNSLTAQAQRNVGDTLSGKYLTIDGNPAIQAAVDAAQRTVNKQFSGDNYGSSANKEWLARGAASAAAPILSQERQNQIAALGIAPSLQQVQSGQLAQAGASQEARSQAELGAAQQQFYAPWQNLGRYQQAISGGLGAGGTTSTSGQQPFYSNPMANALGMGLGGLQLYNGLSSAGLLSGIGGLGAAATAGSALAPLAGMGGVELAMMFSDRRFKSNIRRIGTHRLGIGVYEYDIGGRRQVGVMADEVEAVMPDAVAKVGGVKAVNYGRL